MKVVIIEKRGGKQYIFSSESIIVKKNNKIIYNVTMEDISIIVYCSKAYIKDWFKDILFGGPGTELTQPYKSFNIKLKNDKKIIRLWLNREEFARVKNCLQCRVQVL